MIVYDDKKLRKTVLIGGAAVNEEPKQPDPLPVPSPGKRKSRIPNLIALGLFLFVWLLTSPFLAPYSYSYESYFESLGAALQKMPPVLILAFAGIIIPVISFFALYFIIKFVRTASAHFLFAILALALLGMGLALAWQEQESRIDWTSHGLNPDAPGFKPQVVILSGITGHGYFEIRMRGAEYYYYKTWKGQEWKPGSWYYLKLAIPGCAYDTSLSRGRNGDRGIGGGWMGRPEDLVLARRLWSGTNFIGAKTNEMVAVKPGWGGATEEFQNLQTVGPFLIPKVIKFTESPGGLETYMIKKIEFWSQPSTNWFWQVKQTYFGNNSLIETNDLHEPGPVPERKVLEKINSEMSD